MPDLVAKAKKPYGSRTLGKLFTLVHKVIHSFCAQGRGAAIANSMLPAAQFMRRRNFLNGIKALADYQAHCAQSYPQIMCEMRRPAGNA
jgi:hypothetical protein